MAISEGETSLIAGPATKTVVERHVSIGQSGKDDLSSPSSLLSLQES